jgi:hypothetical protein
VAIKVAAGAQRPRLRREAEVLRRLHDLRVPRLVEVVDAADHTEMVMERHGVLTLADAALLDLGDRRAALGGLCAALDGLHRAGWAHGRIEPMHVLVGPRGRVRLCSLGEAVELTAGSPDALATDLADLAATVLEVLRAEATFNSPLRRWRWDRRARRARRRIATTRGMLTPTALAELCAEELPPPRAARRGRRRPRRLGPGPRPGRRMALLAGVGSAGVLAVLAVAARTDRPHDDAAPPAAGPPSTAPTAPPAPTVTPPSPPTTVAGDGTLRVDGIAYRVGAAGDTVVVGDWNCDGTDTPAVFRPSTGSVFAYDAWATEGSTTRAHPLGRAPGAEGIRPAEACGAPLVEWPGGTLRPLEEDP